MHYAIQKRDGSVSIMQTIPQKVWSTEGGEGRWVMVEPKPQAEIAKWPEADRLAVVSIQAIDPKQIPADRTFRNAWKFDGKRIDHDIPKARNIVRDRLRRQRAPELAALDVAYQRADEASDDKAKATVAARKQRLRDVTKHPAIDTASTVEALKAITLAGLVEGA